MLAINTAHDPYDLSEARLAPVEDGVRIAAHPNFPDGDRHEVRRFRTEHGHFRMHSGINSQSLGEHRDLVVFLPNEYKADPSARFPVLYMHDGQNVLSTVKGSAPHSWNADQTLAAMFRAKHVEPFIVVAVAHSPDNRALNYTADREDQLEAGGGFAAYYQFLKNEVKPLVDDLYRTRADRASTWTAGSSLGGNAALSCVMEQDSVFSRCLALAPTLRWADAAMLKRAASFNPQGDTRIIVDIATHAPEVSQEPFRNLRPVLEGRGMTINGNFFHLRYAPDHSDEGDGHNELSWGRRFGHGAKLLAA